MKSIPGFTEDQIAHLSPNQRAKLLAERQGGSTAIDRHERAVDYARQQHAALEDDQRRLSELDAETLIARRTAEQSMAAERAERQQRENALVNAQKEADDQNEALHGRSTVPASVREHVADAAADLIEQRTEQAHEIGLTEGTTFTGHPETSEGQAEAAQANAEKEVADREQSQNYDASGAYQGATGLADVGIQIAEFDEAGNLIEPETPADQGAGQGGSVAAETGAENNGQANQTSEPTAAELALGGTDAPPSTKRRRNNPAPRAVGDGPVSE